MKEKDYNPKNLLGRRIRALRSDKQWTQQKLGEKANINYKFLGEIERGKQNPSFEILTKITQALNIELFELFRFDHEIPNQKELKNMINQKIKGMGDDDLRKLYVVLKALYP